MSFNSDNLFRRYFFVETIAFLPTITYLNFGCYLYFVLKHVSFDSNPLKYKKSYVVFFLFSI